MWYAGDVICHDEGHILFFIISGILIFVFPIGIYRAMQYYKQHDNTKDSYESTFAPLILSYNDKILDLLYIVATFLF